MVVLDGKGEPRTVHDSGGTWIDRVRSAVAQPCLERRAQRHLQAGEGRGQEPVAALRLRRHRLLPKGQRLALAHYNGATLWYPNVAGEPQKLEWKGSHLGITVSADQRFVVTTMQEPQLHGWRLEDGQHMRMSGYPGKVRSFAWTQGGKFLATSGASEAILWPFSGKNGPMGVNRP